MFVGDACHATRNSTEPERKESANRTQRQGSAKRRSVQIKVDYMQPMRGRSRP